MNNFKKNIFKKRTSNEVIPPEPTCFCDTCEPTENCFSMTINNTADQTNIGVYYQSAELGASTPILPLGALLATDNNNGTTTYYVCSTSFVSIYNMDTNQQISWPEGSFAPYECYPQRIATPKTFQQSPCSNATFWVDTNNVYWYNETGGLRLNGTFSIQNGETTPGMFRWDAYLFTNGIQGAFQNTYESSCGYPEE